MVDPVTVFDIVVGVFGLLALTLQYLYLLIKARLPSSKLRVLDETLEQTQSLLDTCVEEGRLRRGNLAEDYQRRLNELKTDANQLRIETLSAKTYFEDFKNMLNGLSRRTDGLCEQVTKIRVTISLSSADAPNSRAESEDNSHSTDDTEAHAEGRLSSFDDTSNETLTALPLQESTEAILLQSLLWRTIWAILCRMASCRIWTPPPRLLPMTHSHHYPLCAPAR
ncbi:hypothetical protein OH77DRAFT_828288 [Trametes cingulata]|nr:hypothetical protein OH77DRAFT_828288 [Trametes cingulata]